MQIPIFKIGYSQRHKTDSPVGERKKKKQHDTYNYITA